MGLPALLADLGLFKAAMDAVKAALGAARQAKDLLPTPEREALVSALDRTERDLTLAEVQIAVALGFPLCRCSFPGTPMLAIGLYELMAKDANGRRVSEDLFTLHQCPRCKTNDEPGAPHQTYIFKQPPSTTSSLPSAT